ncbi:methionine--tRNA ligase subunit beta [Candidatus Micrarchaeota archaeon]|nr:methionine--tRNA ligase subunit beta [Candidatus Micrarchaeota archaeon]
METIPYGDFAKLELRVGEITKAEAVEGTDKLVKLSVDVGEGTERTLAAGIRKVYPPEELVGKKIIVLVNLEPKKLKGIESQGMLLAACESDDNLSLLTVDKDMPAGTKIC